MDRTTKRLRDEGVPNAKAESWARRLTKRAHAEADGAPKPKPKNTQR
ncbi:MAG: hypothetical protein GY913_15330 [Proteobacteria bacterium]|nr:hypothetical protein [Pseudomonadota bacterium]